MSIDIPDSIHVPDLSRVPHVSPLEGVCRSAGAIPKNNVDRRRRHDDVMRLVEQRLRRGEFGIDDLNTFAAYREGEFNINHRPMDENQEQLRQTIGEHIEAIQRRDGCTLEAAVRAFLEEHFVHKLLIENGNERLITSDDDPDDEIASYIINFMKR